MTGKQGPKTLSGKAKSAANSTVHGFRSSNISTVEQQKIYDSFLKELIDYYDPHSPLEKLQLERIATCKAKLQSLYALENAKLSVMLREFGSDPHQLLKQYKGVQPLVRGMMYELIRWRELTLPCNLDPETLEKIHEEIQSFAGEIADEKHLKSVFPVLVSFLLSFESEDADIDSCLIVISEKIIQSISRGENYCEFFNAHYFDELNASESEPELTDEQIEFENEINEIQMQSNRRNGFPKLRININNSEFKDAKHLQKVLKPFTELYLAYKYAISLIDHIQAFIEDKKSSLSLPQADADLLLRYQTTWERRLSSSIGEFLRLQELSSAKAHKSIK